MSTDLWQCILIVTVQCCPTGSTGHHHLLSHSVTLSWHRANQSLPYPNNAKCRLRQLVSILKSLVWLDQVSNLRARDSNPGPSDSPISQNEKRALCSFGHPDWSQTAVSKQIWATLRSVLGLFKLLLTWRHHCVSTPSIECIYLLLLLHNTYLSNKYVYVLYSNK